MKKILLLVLALMCTFSTFSQGKKKPVYRKDKFNISATRPWKQLPGEEILAPAKQKPMTAPDWWEYSENGVGTSIYDLQTSGSTASRIYVYPDSIIGVTWMYGTASPDFGDRGTAYNYYDGVSWGADPTSRIETVKTGYPSYCPYGPNGEATLAHDFSTPGGLILCKREQKGTGNWTQMSIPGPAGQNGLAWPRMVASGNDHQYLHTLAITRPTTYPGGTIYQGLNGAILYSRSSDGGTTWDISNMLLPGMTSTEYNGFESNSYAMADPVGNNIAFVVGDTWTDLFLMKSTDNGASWTKTIIFQHPYPKFDETHDLVIDTPWVSDGGVAVALDNQGKAHVFFGLMRVLNSDTTDGNTSYFPYSDGLAYWNENIQPFTNLNFDTLWDQNHIVGSVPDINGNDTVMEFVGIGTYYLSLTGMPTVSISPDNIMALCYSTVIEGLDDGTRNYRHIYAQYTIDNQNWNNTKDLTGSIIHNFNECVFPFLSPTINHDSPTQTTTFHLVYQFDDQPGMAVWGSDPPDPFTTNYLTYGKFYDYYEGVEEMQKIPDINVLIQPNPASKLAEISLDLRHSAQLSLCVRNSLGQLVYSLPASLTSAGTHYYKLDVSTFSPGLYFFSVKSGETSITNKLVVQH